jgi:sigma-E factor negative regulatory protein RseC
MNSAQGRIISLSSDELGTRAVVVIETAAACPRCASGKGCGAALLSGTTRRVDVLVPEKMSVDQGDIVAISMTSESLLQASLLVYGLPLLAALSGAAIAYGLSLSDAAASLSAVAGLAAGIAFARHRVSRLRCLQRFVPIVTNRVQKASV